MKQPPRDPQEPVLTRRHWGAIFGYGGLITVPVLTSFWLAAGLLKTEPAQTVTVSFMTLAFAQLWHVFNMRDAESRLARNEITMNPYIWAALTFCTCLLLGAVYLPGISTVLTLADPGLTGWLVILVMSLIPLAAGQTLKTLPGRRS